MMLSELEKAYSIKVKWVRRLSDVDLTKSGGYMYVGTHLNRNANLPDGVYLLALDKDVYFFVELHQGAVLDKIAHTPRAVWSKKDWARDLATRFELSVKANENGSKRDESEGEELEIEEVEWDEPESSSKEMSGCHVLRVAKNISLGDFLALIPAELKEKWSVTDEDLSSYLKRNKVLQIGPLDIL